MITLETVQRLKELREKAIGEVDLDEYDDLLRNALPDLLSLAESVLKGTEGETGELIAKLEAVAHDVGGTGEAGTASKAAAHLRALSAELVEARQLLAAPDDVWFRGDAKTQRARNADDWITRRDAFLNRRAAK